MRHIVLAFFASLALSAVMAVHGVAQISVSQVILSCNDGHSVIISVDQIMLTSLVADVQSINASGTGFSCALNTAPTDPSSVTAKWTVYDYNPSNRRSRRATHPIRCRLQPPVIQRRSSSDPPSILRCLRRPTAA